MKIYKYIKFGGDNVYTGTVENPIEYIEQEDIENKIIDMSQKLSNSIKDHNNFNKKTDKITQDYLNSVSEKIKSIDSKNCKLYNFYENNNPNIPENLKKSFEEYNKLYTEYKNLPLNLQKYLESVTEQKNNYIDKIKLLEASEKDIKKNIEKITKIFI